MVSLETGLQLQGEHKQKLTCENISNWKILHKRIQTSYQMEGNQTPDKWPLFIIHRKLIDLNNEKTMHPKQIAEKLDWHLFKEDIQIASGYIEKYSSLLTIGEVQMKTTISYHCITHTMKKFMSRIRNNFWWGYGEIGTSIYC